MNIHEMETRCLLHSYVQIRDELMRRKITHSARNLIGDYTQWCVVNALDLTFNQTPCANGAQAIDADGKRYLIRGKHLTGNLKKGYQITALKQLRRQKFDFMVVVIFDEVFDVQEAWLIPHRLVLRYASYHYKSKTHSLVLRGPLLNHPQVVSIKEMF